MRAISQANRRVGDAETGRSGDTAVPHSNRFSPVANRLKITAPTNITPMAT